MRLRFCETPTNLTRCANLPLRGVPRASRRERLHNPRHSGESRDPEGRCNGDAPTFLRDSHQFDKLCKHPLRGVSRVSRREPLHNLRHSGESRPFTGRNVHPEGRCNGDAPTFLRDSHQFDELCKHPLRGVSRVSRREPLHNLRHSGESRPFTGRNVHPEGRCNGDAQAFRLDSQRSDELYKHPGGERGYCGCYVGRIIAASFGLRAIFGGRSIKGSSGDDVARPSSVGYRYGPVARLHSVRSSLLALYSDPARRRRMVLGMTGRGPFGPLTGHPCEGRPQGSPLRDVCTTSVIPAKAGRLRDGTSI